MPTLVDGGTYYLCCNLFFNRDRRATDANYRYAEDGSILAVGTRVRIDAVGHNIVRFHSDGQAAGYSLELRFGLNRVAQDEYFRQILRDAGPRGSDSQAAPDILTAISVGQLLPGMTKGEALMARGFPPYHQTDGITSDEWIYYESLLSVARVRFVEGKLASTVFANAP